MGGRWGAGGSLICDLLSAITRTSRFSITESRDGRAPRFLAVSMAEEGSELEDPPLEMA